MGGLALFGSNVLVRRRVFISYHHSGDQAFYDAFSMAFHDAYELICDTFLERRIDSDHVDYVLRRIRENYITGSSCTIVLVGAETWGRKYVDWEIEATLQKTRGLIGVKLLFELVARHRRDADVGDVRPAVVNYLPWPVHSMKSREYLSGLREDLDGIGELHCLDKEGHAIAYEARGGPSPAAFSDEDWASSLTAMRRVQTEAVDTRIVLGDG